jgi:hypothetical protein
MAITIKCASEPRNEWNVTIKKITLGKILAIENALVAHSEGGSALALELLYDLREAMRTSGASDKVK